MPPRFIALIAAAALTTAAHAGADFPEGFSPTIAASGFDQPVGLTFAPDGRMFVWEQRGMVWVVENGSTLPTPFIDLRDEINGAWDRGLLGLALDPGFLVNRHLYLLYIVDPIAGRPDDGDNVESFGRLTRYTGTAASGGNVADDATRLVLIGDPPSTGIPSCHSSHSVGSLRFALDGTLFVTSGDGAHWDTVDPGGIDPPCFVARLFGADQDVGAFRSQYLGSLAGKILRVDPATGLGLPTNPFWTGLASDTRSKIWASGLRNPYRVAVRPGSPPPGTIYAGDVGWYSYEEINVAHGGENFGWPCREGSGAAPSYPGENPINGACDEIETPANPGPLTGPLVDWHHFNGIQSHPAGPTGRAATGAVFYTGTSYPAIYHDTLFHADLGAGGSGWIRVIDVDGSDELVSTFTFASGLPRVVDLAIDPADGELHYVSIDAGQVIRVEFDPGVFADIDDDGDVDVDDLVQVVTQWGPCASPPAACPADVDQSGVVDVNDLVLII